jgi:hypothetical protein
MSFGGSAPRGCVSGGRCVGLLSMLCARVQRNFCQWRCWGPPACDGKAGSAVRQTMLRTIERGERVPRADVVSLRCAGGAFSGGFGASAAGRAAAPAAAPSGGFGASGATATPAGGGFTGVFRDSAPQKADIYEGALMCIHAHAHAHAHSHAHACS